MSHQVGKEAVQRSTRLFPGGPSKLREVDTDRFAVCETHEAVHCAQGFEAEFRFSNVVDANYVRSRQNTAA